MRFLVDNQLPATLSRCLVKLGHESVHVSDVGFDGSTDKQIWDYAVRQGYVIISKDADFFDLQLTQRKCTPVIWVRLGNCRTGYLCSVFERHIKAIVEQLHAGDTLLEIID